MTPQTVRLIALASPDLEKIVGAGQASQRPNWSDHQFHSSDPQVPLNDRTDRFVTVIGVYATDSVPDLAVIEIRDSARLIKTRIPPIHVLGHVVEVLTDYGTATSARERIPVKPFFEIRVDGKTIGALDGQITDLEEIGKAATRIAKDYIVRAAAEKNYRFADSLSDSDKPR
jgi:hypothetical protein